jgi:hypothetical protein
MASFNVVTEQEDLRLFLQDRVAAYDDSIDTSLGSAFDNDVIQPLLARLGPDPYVTPIVEFIQGRLAAEFENLVIQDGEPIDDLVIRPNRLLLEAYRRQINLVSTNQSVANPELMNEREADALAANYFIPRRLGGFSVGTARLYYSAAQYALVTPSNAIFTGGGLQFFPIESQGITADRMILNEENGLFYFDVAVRAEAEGAQYNIEPETLTGIDGQTSVVKVVNKSRFEEGDDKESTEEYLARVEQSLTERSLVTVRGINARVLDVFENVRLVQVIGFGDPEMQRDLLKGTSSSTPYAVALVVISGGGRLLTLDGNVGLGGSVSPGFLSAGVRVGDLVTVYGDDLSFDLTRVVESVTEGQIVLEDATTISPATGTSCTIRGPQGTITISDIPGGILGPDPTIEIKDGEVHIGGVLDVFVRAGDPQERDFTLEGVLDGEPLRFGTDLETYGGESPRYVHVTEAIANGLAIPSTDRHGNALSEYLELVIAGNSSSPIDQEPWRPTEADIDRYIQVVPPAPGSDFQGTYRISQIIGQEYYSGVLSTRILISKENKERNDTDSAWYTSSSNPTMDLSFRIVEEESAKSWVRDRDGSSAAIAEDDPDPGDPVILGGVDFFAVGTTIGDSVVLETGPDAGIYSVRRVLSWLTDGDTLILDRDLTSSQGPTSPGTDSGIRYRIADELNVDLVSPRVTKIPIEGSFDGDDLSSVAGSQKMTATGGTNFLVAGVEVGDTLEILGGGNAGTYAIEAVSGSEIEVDAPAANTLAGQQFSIYRAYEGVSLPLVRVKSVELLDSNSQPTGISVPYGDVIDVRVQGGLSNKAQGNIVESFTGEFQDNGDGIIDLYDPEVDFDGEGVEAGYRLNIINTDSAGAYTVLATGSDPEVGLTEHHLRIRPVSGTTGFLSTDSDVHYSVGQASSGIARLFFLEPTSVNIQTGIDGGRLSDGTNEYRFSEVDGQVLVPAPGSVDDDGRDFRTCRTYSETVNVSWSTTGTGNTSGNTFTDSGASFLSEDIRSTYVLRILTGADAGTYDISSVSSETTLVVSGSAFTGASGANYEILRYETIAELVDTNRPGVFELEIQEGDEVEVHEPIQFRVSNSGGSFTGQTFEEAGIFGTPSGLLITAGSNLVSVPSNSAIDFQVMDSNFPLSGQWLYIESGPDEGRYVIESVVDAKTLRIDSVMLGTSTGVDARDVNSRSGLTLAASGSNTKLTDSDDAAQLDSLTTGQYITIFESTRGDIDGAYVISDVLSSESGAVEIEASLTDHSSLLDSQSVGPFSWIATSEDGAGPYQFRIYRSIPTEFEVVEVAPKRSDVTGVRRGSVSGTFLTDAAGAGMSTLGVAPGDIVEVLEGPSKGMYHAEGVLSDLVTVTSEVPFPVALPDVAYRVWGGLHGSRRMLRLGPKDSSDGRAEVGPNIPYRILRPGIYRASSTEMEPNFDGALYYVDVQIESDGAGDNLNLSDDTRLEVLEGIEVDGYTYSVGNETLTFSVFEEVSLIFDRRFLPVGNSDSPENLTEVSGRNLRVTYETSVPTKLVNDLMRSVNDRPVNANPIARHFLPSYVYTSLQYSGGVSEEEMGAAMEDLIHSLGAEAELRVSDLEKILIRRGAETVEHPIELVTVTHDLGRRLVVNRSDNKVGGVNEVPYNGTGRQSAFFTEFEETLLLTRE